MTAFTGQRGGGLFLSARVLLFVSVGLVIVAMVALCGSAGVGFVRGPDDHSPAWLSNSVLAFTAYDAAQGGYVVQAVNVDGRPLGQVFVPPTTSRFVAAAPTAPLVAFRVVREGAQWLAVSASDGSQTRTLFKGGELVEWTADSSHLIFSDGPIGWPRSRLYSIRPDGTDLIAYPATVRGLPSPDGTRFAYATETEFSKLHLVNADGTGDRRLTSAGPFIIESNPLWSPDGSRLAFSRSDLGQREVAVVKRVVVVRISGGPTRAFASLARAPDCCFPYFWSRDGRTIFGATYLKGPPSAAARDRDRLRLIRTGASGEGLVGFDVATGKPRVVLHGIPDAVFSPDGSRIAYEAEGECSDLRHIYIANADGSGRRLISNNCHIVGTPDNDVLNGRVVIGLAGNDFLNGTDTLDKLYGGPGNDNLYGGASADIFVGGPGRDHLYGGAGRDLIDAQDGQRDWISCGTNGYQGAGHDTVYADRTDIVSDDCEIVHRR